VASDSGANDELDIDYTGWNRPMTQASAASRKAAIISDALREFSRSGKARRNKYEIALDALIRVEEAFDGDHAASLEDVLAVLREKADDGT
jgi:hypothetical protein